MLTWNPPETNVSTANDGQTTARFGESVQNCGRGQILELTKQAVYHAMGVSLQTHAEYEENLLNKVHNTEDVKEGRLAFREKRTPVFKGR
jgi:enoyl-CoA hydratase/carnithine racemase